MISLVCFSVCMLLAFEPRASCILSEHATKELHPHPCKQHINSPQVDSVCSEYRKVINSMYFSMILVLSYF